MSSVTAPAAEPPVAPSGEARSIRYIAFYYALLVGGAWALARFWPAAQAALHLQPLADPTRSGSLENALGRPLGQAPGILALASLDAMLVAALSMVGALMLMAPVAWSYILVKRRTGYDQSVVHALLILPVAVTGIVMIVQDSIALAFSLAGIVAAVRFRTTLEDTKDAVYVFLAIAVGLAAGVQALALAFVLSFVFITIDLVLWKLGFGNLYVDQAGRTGHLTLGDVLAGPKSAQKAVSFGDRRLLQALNVGDLKHVAEQVARMEQYLKAADVTRKDRKAYSVLLVHAEGVAEAQKAIEPQLQGLTVRWSLAEIVPRESGMFVLEYLVRPREDVSEGMIMDAVRAAGGPFVRAAEMRSLKALAKRL